MRSRAMLGWCALAVVVVALAAASILLTGSRGTALDPDNPKPSGAQAVARVLADHGVQVHPVRDRDGLDSAPAGAGTTLVVTHPENLSPGTLRDLAGRHVSRLVLVDPDAYVVDQLGLPVLALGAVSGTASGGCRIPDLRGLRISGFDHTYATTGQSPRPGTPPTPPAGCFSPPHNLGQVLVELTAPAGGTRIVLIGSTAVLRNDDILAGDNAAIALRLLGHDRTLVWFAASPSAQEASAGAPSVWPHWVPPAIIVVAFAALLLILWRARRLGRLVPEPLPVIVPANEITRSRGQLYRRARATTRTTAILRQATRARLTAYLGLPPGAPPATVTEAVARATGRDPTDVHRVLFAPLRADEGTMTSTAQDLQTLERQTRLHTYAATPHGAPRASGDQPRGVPLRGPR